ncbi:unnamed protein product [Psylliodes chrysocephalus]|uniref:Serpin domain-containing protein n=1 Tax=Psylliodes chrysocephalus TaxID=3402493 RepID=A0A9P0CZF7_9CUCU|nr:unnamed protein product [Psylliodes chrysocephala]
MWVLPLLLIGTVFVTAQNTEDDIKDGELSRKILGQSVVTSVSVVMDIGNGTKTVFTDPLGKPVEKPASSSELASPINLLNPDRYEFYTFDDNGNLVRRLMSLEEIKGIIATGDSDGLEYDSAMAEAYIPEKRVNDVLNNVQNVLKEEMEIHNTKLDSFPTLDTPDVSDSWNMILPAVFGNSGADITPEKPPLHVTPDTIMIEPTEQHQSTPRSTPMITSTKGQSTSSKQGIRISSSTSNPTTPARVTVSSSISLDQHNDLKTESKEEDVRLTQALDLTTKEYVPLSTISPHYEKVTTNTEIDTTVRTTKAPNKIEYIKIDQTTENYTNEKSTELLTVNNQADFTTVTSTASEISQTTNLPELTIQSVESSINCTSVKNESDGTSTIVPMSTLVPMFDEVNSILNQLLSTPFGNELHKNATDSTNNNLLNANTEIINETDKLSTVMNILSDRIETTSFASEEVKKNETKDDITTHVAENDSTEEYSTTVTRLSENTNKNNNIINDFNEETSVMPTTLPTIETTTVENNKNTFSTEKVDIRPITENQFKPVDNDIPVKSTKLENTKEAIKNDEHIVKSTPANKNQDNLNAITILEPITLIDSSTITSNDLNDTTIRVPLIDPSESKIHTIKPSVGIFINETQIDNADESNKNNTAVLISSTEMYDESKITINLITKENVNMSETSVSTTERLHLITKKLPSATEKLSSTTEKLHSTTEKLPSTTKKLPSTTEKLSSTTEKLHSTTEKLPSTTKKLPSTTEKLPSSTEKLPSTTKKLPSTTEKLISTTKKLPSTTEKLPSTTEKLPSTTEKLPSTTEKLPSTTEKTSTTIKTPATEQISLITEKTPSTTDKISQLTERINTVTQSIQETKITDIMSISNEGGKKEPNWTLVPTIAPHSGGTLGTPLSTSESYPDVLDPPEPINLKAEPLSGFGLEESTSTLDRDIYQFSQLYNELAFEFWKTTTSSLSHARSFVLSPFGTISLLAMIFLGARGSTSAEMNEILKLDDMITFNPHLVLKNVGESVMADEKDSGVVTSAFIKELFMCRLKGKFLPFYKERVRAFYDGYAEEVNFKEIGDIIRRRTNLQVKKHSDGKIAEFLTDMSVVGRPPLIGFGINIFQTDCSSGFSEGRDGEMHFTVLPTIRQRRLVPIPAVLYKSGFLAGYEPSLDATAVSIGGKSQTISTIFVMPGQQGTPAPGDGLSRLEKSLVESSLKKGAWPRLLRSLIPRAGLEVQIPKIIHRSVVNTTEALKKMGFVELFKKGRADLVGMNGISNELYLSDMIQVNQFTTCAEKRTEHHSEIYPNSIGRSQRSIEDLPFSSIEDPLHDISYLKLPLPLRPRQARKPVTPRLKFDRPFLYFVRHNPTGLILHIGRFNPRLLP